MGIFFFLTPESYQKLDAFSIWVLSSIALLYLSRKKVQYLAEREKLLVIIAGIFLCIFSFLNIPLGFGNPPYSIGDFSILLSGIGLIYFGLLRLRSAIIPVLLPALGVFGFQFYELFLRHEGWITAPMIPVIVFFSILILHMVGIPANADGNVISFFSQSGEMIYLAIVSDCTGIWSLGTFTFAILIVAYSFENARTRHAGIAYLIGYIGTVLANLLRIFIIAMTGYIYGPSGIIENAHIHVGWIVFTLWMVIFWVVFFAKILHFDPLALPEKED